MNLLFSLCLCLLFPSPIKICQAPVTPKLDTVKMVSSIKTQYLAIDAQRKSLSLYTPTAKVEGNTFFGYLDGSKPKMINVGAYGDSAKVEADEYLDDSGKIIMIYAKQSIYETPLSINSRSAVKATIDNFYYFNNESLIKWVSGGKVIPVGSEAFKRMSAYYAAELPKHRKQFADINGLQKIR